MEQSHREQRMLFTLLGLVAATLFGVFFGSEGELPKDIQDRVFISLIATGAVLNGLQILYEKLCRRCGCWFCIGG